MGTAAIVGGGMKLIGARKQRKAGKAADAIGRENAAATLRETQAQVKRTKEQQEQSLGSARARSGASGIRSGAGSTTDFLEEMQRVFAEDIQFMEESGASQASIERAQGRLAKKQATASAWGSAASGVSSIAGFWS